MSRRAGLFISAFALLALTAGTLYVHRLEVQRWQEIAALTARSATLENAVTAQRRDTAAVQSELAAASRQLAELPATVDPAERDMQSWVARVKRLRQLFVDRPQQAIPELRLLDDRDWLRAARVTDHLDTEQDIREALSVLRNAAATKFANRLTSAVQKYMRTGSGQKPDSVLALAPYLEPPADVAMLQRWELADEEGTNRNGIRNWAVRQGSAIDPDYDTRYNVKSTNGISALSAPIGWIENYEARATSAYRRYAEANHGTPPPDFATVAPFFQPALDPKIVDRMVQMERERKRQPKP